MEFLSAALKDGTLIQLLVFLVPGFIAWKTHQSRRPQGTQKTAEAIVEIIVYGVLNTIVWTYFVPLQHWTVWPQQRGEVTLFLLELIISPIIIAVLLTSLVDVAAQCGLLNWPHPTAWDWIFNKLARKNAYAVILTLKDGRKIAGAYKKPGFVALYPYSKDIFLGEVWTLDSSGRFDTLVSGARGIYVEKKDVLTIELFDYTEVIADVIKRSMPDLTKRFEE